MSRRQPESISETNPGFWVKRRRMERISFHAAFPDAAVAAAFDVCGLLWSICSNAKWNASLSPGLHRCSVNLVEICKPAASFHLGMYFDRKSKPNPPLLRAAFCVPAVLQHLRVSSQARLRPVLAPASSRAALISAGQEMRLRCAAARSRRGGGRLAKRNPPLFFFRRG